MGNYNTIKQHVNAIEPIAKGQRNITLYKLGCSLREKFGLTGKELETVLSETNQTKCIPPLPPDEITTITRSVNKNSDPVEVGSDGNHKPIPRQKRKPNTKSKYSVTHGGDPIPVAELRKRKVSLYNGCIGNLPAKKSTIGKILDTFRTGGNSIDQIRAVRNESDKDKRNELKKLLPAVVFGSEPQQERKAECCKPNGILCLDFDGISDDKIASAKNAIAKVGYIAAVGLSVSGNGLFALAVYEGTPDLKILLAAIQADFSYPLDRACSDICRLRIVSFDPDIIIKDTVFPAVLNERVTTESATQPVFDKIGIEVIDSFLEQIKAISFLELEGGKPKHCTYYVNSIEHLLKTAKEYQWDIGIKNAAPYFFTGQYWQWIEQKTFRRILQAAGTRQSIPNNVIKDHLFVEKLEKQFASEAHFPVPIANNVPKIGLQNCTLHISPSGVEQKPFDKQDGLTYQLGYDYDPSATAPLFTKFLNRVLPDSALQKLIFQYIGYVFLRNMKLDKVLFLYGGGANGKSVFLNVIRGLVGSDQCCEFSLEGITKSEAQRAELGKYLLNISSEISARMGTTAIFKKIASREPLQVRHLYGKPFNIQEYATSIFAMNELPQDVEQTSAFFRRFIIIPFNVRIPDEEQDPELTRKIIDGEMSGVLNYVIEGVKSLLAEGKFDVPNAVQKAVNDFQQESDSVLTFLTENNYVSDVTYAIPLQDLHSDYKKQSLDDGHCPVAKRKFAQRLRNLGYEVKKAGGQHQTVVFAVKEHEQWDNEEVPV